MTVWQRVVGKRPIVTRLVLAVAAAMGAVLLAAAAFVYWRVEFALNRQLNQDLAAYQQVVQKAVRTGVPAPRDTSGETYQVFDSRGRVVGGDSGDRPLIDSATRSAAFRGTPQTVDFGSFIPPSDPAYRAVVERVPSPDGPVVVASAISRRKHDEALRELLLQLAITDLAALVAASFVGYRTARAALDPVERYRAAVEEAGSDLGRRLPVAAGREDELTRLGHTFNGLLTRIDEANLRERQFLADASHELRTPLSLMRTELEYVLHRRRDPDETETALVSLRDQVERLVELANALLDLEELRSDSSLLRENVDLSELVDEVVRRFAARAVGEQRLISCNVDTIVVVANRRWLDLALMNLLSNAFRYGAGEVLVTGSVQGDRVVLAVEDEGTGFAVDFVDRAFDRFTRAEESRSTGGSGLGLSLVQAVAEAHGGRARIEEGHPSRVVIDLPVHVRQAPAGSG
jgi:signal transduction histidine kinase